MKITTLFDLQAEASSQYLAKNLFSLFQSLAGVIVQPLYQTALPATVAVDGGYFDRPLEVKLKVIFGVAVGGTVNMHPFDLWITRAGDPPYSFPG